MSRVLISKMFEVTFRNVAFLSLFLTFILVSPSATVVVSKTSSCQRNTTSQTSKTSKTFEGLFLSLALGATREKCLERERKRKTICRVYFCCVVMMGAGCHNLIYFESITKFSSFLRVYFFTFLAL